MNQRLPTYQKNDRNPCSSPPSAPDRSTRNISRCGPDKSTGCRRYMVVTIPASALAFSAVSFSASSFLAPSAIAPAGGVPVACNPAGGGDGDGHKVIRL